jgi:hypothetical protein
MDHDSVSSGHTKKARLTLFTSTLRRYAITNRACSTRPNIGTQPLCNPRSWYGRSRARVATGVSLTAPGIPMLFMGQEFLEDKQWSDNFQFHHNLLLHWAGLDAGDKQSLIMCVSRGN